jgi:hypothetical protein
MRTWEMVAAALAEESDALRQVEAVAVALEARAQDCESAGQPEAAQTLLEAVARMTGEARGLTPLSKDGTPVTVDASGRNDGLRADSVEMSEDGVRFALDGVVVAWFKDLAWWMVRLED